jgi:hypothetical protein
MTNTRELASIITTTITISATNLKSTPSTIDIILESSVLTTKFLTLIETTITSEQVFQNIEVTRIVTTTNSISIKTLESKFTHIYGESSTNSALDICQTLSLDLSCIKNTCDCEDRVWSVIQRKCLNCMSEWLLIGKTCYRVSKYFPSLSFDLI